MVDEDRSTELWRSPYLRSSVRFGVSASCDARDLDLNKLTLSSHHLNPCLVRTKIETFYLTN